MSKLKELIVYKVKFSQLIQLLLLVQDPQKK